MRPSVSLNATAKSVLSAFSLSGRFSLGIIALFFDALYELRQFAEMHQLFALLVRLRAGRRREHVDARAIQRLFLQSTFALALRKLLVSQLAVEGHNTRSKLLQFLRQNDAALGKVRAR